MTERSDIRRGIAVVGLRGIPNVMGGVETHCEELLPRLARLDPTLAISVLGRASYLPAGTHVFHGVAVVPLPAPRMASIEATISTLIGICYARGRGFRFVHIHAIGPGLLAPFARLLGMRVVVTHHGEDFNRGKWGRFARTILKLGEAASARAAHRMICVSPTLAGKVADRYPRARAAIRFIPNGAPAMATTPRDDAAVLATLGLEPHGYVLAVGRLVPEKGFDYLIEAHNRSGTNRPLVIAGAADHDSEYSRALIDKAGDDVRFLGRQPREVLTALYCNAGLFVLPSFHEGLPIVALEAARCNAPMLLSDIDPNRDIGLAPHHYYPVGDSNALAAALARPSSTYAVDGAAISRRFDWDAIARETLVTYREAMA